MKVAPLALLFVWAAPARADVSVKLPPTWRDLCAKRIDAAATATGLSPGARRDALPLLREDGSPNPMQLVEFGSVDVLFAAVGTESDRRKDKPWTLTAYRGGKPSRHWFRRAHGMYAKIDLAGDSSREKPFKAALDECLQMGESK